MIISKIPPSEGLSQASRGEVLILVVLIILILVSVIAIPGLMRSRNAKSWSPCQAHLHCLQHAKQVWAAETKSATDKVPTAADLAPIFKETKVRWNEKDHGSASLSNAVPVCPLQGGAYVIGPVGTPPTCPHSIQSGNNPPNRLHLFDAAAFKQDYGPN